MSLYQQVLALISGAPTQADRLLVLHTPLGKDVLLAERAQIDEAIGPGTDGDAGAGCRVVVHALAADTHIELKSLIGQPALLELLPSDSRTTLRPFHGHVVQAELLGSDGGLARYRLVIDPWLSFLAHRHDAYVFQHKTVVQIVEADPEYRDNTLWVVVPDCGRDDNPYTAVPCQHHFGTRSSHEIFALFFGRGIPRGKVVDRTVSQIQVASTVGQLMGMKTPFAENAVLEEAFA